MASVISAVRGVQKLPEGPFWESLGCALVEWAGDVRIIDLADGQEGLSAEFSGSVAGVAFGPYAELKWMKRAGGFHFVLISDLGDVLDGAVRLQGVQPQAKMETVFLWGRRAGDRLYEDRIPREFAIGGAVDPEERRLRYPKGTPLPKEKARLALAIKSYDLTVSQPQATEKGVAWANGQAVISRWVEFTTRDQHGVTPAGNTGGRGGSSAAK